MSNFNVDWEHSKYDVQADGAHLFQQIECRWNPERMVIDVANPEFIAMGNTIRRKMKITTGYINTDGAFQTGKALTKRHRAEDLVEILRELGFRNIRIREAKTSQMTYTYDEYD